eukprot:GHVN01096574.1.p1 GENE.GHVN01096574.1~~GHVN01096574.1.p1  ORF type:complete len:413 (+),score=50.29 GHVN01096574.1:412-1650(+)
MRLKGLHGTRPTHNAESGVKSFQSQTSLPAQSSPSIPPTQSNTVLMRVRGMLGLNKQGSNDQLQPRESSTSTIDGSEEGLSKLQLKALEDEQTEKSTSKNEDRHATFCRSSTRSQTEESLSNRADSLVQVSSFPSSEYQEEVEPVYRFQPYSQNERKTIVLDLDDTLVWSEVIPCPPENMHEHGIHQIELAEGIPFNFKIHERPGARELLRALAAKSFELVVFTAGIKKYADKVIDQLLSEDPSLNIERRFYRDHCKKETCINEKTGEKKTGYVKDLTLVRSDLTQVVICDDNWVSYNMHVMNACPMAGWFPANKQDPVLDYADRDLYVLANFLTEHIFHVPDVRCSRSGVYSTWLSDSWQVKRLAERKKHHPAHKWGQERYSSSAAATDKVKVSSASAAIAMGNTITTMGA